VALEPPDPPLSDGAIVLRPMDERDVEAVERLSRADAVFYSLLPSDVGTRRLADPS